jgi:ferritin-like metal-binding protein YciE
MQAYVEHLNIARFTSLLEKATDQTQRATLERLLAEEKVKLALREARQLKKI